MKKALCVSFVFLFMFFMYGCGDSSKSNEILEDTHLSESEAESYATSALYSRLMSVYGNIYDISQTRYSVASMKYNATGYTVNGTYSLYDKYGNYKKSNNFSVIVSRDGTSTVTEY